mmetsp:Transcript_2643/g.11573  ORF Transcript_2643/g.11573 Transcript_2643/m.11573 type:complete len:468 (-) Transcript_2643:2184-3587(-)
MGLGFLVWSGGGGFGVRSRRRLVGCSVVAPAEERSVRLALGKLKVEVLPEPLKFSSSWRTMVETLESMGLTGTRLSKLLRKRPALLELDPMETVIPFVRTVTTVLDYDTKGASILLCKRPSLMDYPEIAVAEVLSILLSLGIEERPLRFLLLRFPGIAEINPSQVRSSLRYLVKDAGFKINELWPLIRDSPWVMCYDVETECTPVIEFLEEIGVQNVKLIIQTEPRVLGCSVPEQLESVYKFLLSIGLSRRAIPLVFQLFPSVLIASIEEKLVPNRDYLISLGLTRGDVAHMVRAFPQILVMDIEEEMAEVVRFLESKGVDEIAEFVFRLPSVLAYDVDSNIKPKLSLLKRVGYEMRQIVEFPGCLSFSLEDVIIPRLAFLRYLGVDVSSKRLPIILACSEDRFCERVASRPTSEFKEFCRDLAERRGVNPRPGKQRKRRRKGRTRKNSRAFPTRCRFPISELSSQR